MTHPALALGSNPGGQGRTEISVPRRALYAVPAALFMVSLLVGAWSLGTSSAAGSAPPCVSASHCAPIRHIVFLIKEDRTFDSLFGRFPGANGTTTYRTSDGKRHPLNHQPLQFSQSITKDAESARQAWDNGKMDGFSQLRGAFQVNPYTHHVEDMPDSQLEQSDVPNYWAYAQRFTLADNFFASVNGNSFPNHLFMVAAQAANTDSIPSNQFDPRTANRWGCDSPSTSLVEQQLPSGQYRYTYPCFNFQTLTDLLDRAHISWKYYAPSKDQPGYKWSALDAVKHVRRGSDWPSNVVNTTQFVRDAAAGTLPAVSWVVPFDAVSDHPDLGNICNGENWTVQQINAVMSNRAEWNHTAIVLTWDEWGGFYDHAPPPRGPNPWIQYGFRVPAIIISPYARRSDVDHTFYTFASLPKLAESLFGLPSLNAADRSAHNLLAAFNFSQPPQAPLVLRPHGCAMPDTVSRVRRAAIIGGTSLVLGALLLILTAGYIMVRRPALAGPVLTISPWAQLILLGGVLACGLALLALLERVWV